jgi:hypothetical protein
MDRRIPIKNGGFMGFFMAYREIRDDGLLHKSNGPAVTLMAGGTAWWLYGNQHRYYGPQYSFEEDTEWCIHGEFIK